MKVEKIGRYRFTEQRTLRTNSISSATFPVGMEISITQIDEEFNKIIGPELGDWQYNDLPLEIIAEPAS